MYEYAIIANGLRSNWSIVFLCSFCTVHFKLKIKRFIGNKFIAKIQLYGYFESN